MFWIKSDKESYLVLQVCFTLFNLQGTHFWSSLIQDFLTSLVLTTQLLYHAQFYLSTPFFNFFLSVCLVLSAGPLTFEKRWFPLSELFSSVFGLFSGFWPALLSAQLIYHAQPEMSTPIFRFFALFSVVETTLPCVRPAHVQLSAHEKHFRNKSPIFTIHLAFHS
jgi:hypothetical protein